MHNTNVIPTTLTAHASVIVKTLQAKGIDSEPLLLEAGLDPSQLNQGDARFPYPAMTRFWDLAMSQTGDDCFGLAIIEHWQPANLQALGFAWLASNTLKEALQRMERYVRIINTAASIELVPASDVYKVHISFMPDDIEPQPSYAAQDAGMALLVHLCRLSDKASLSPLKVQVKRPKPRCYEQFTRYFNAPVEFSADVNILSFDKQTIEKRLPLGNMELALSCEKILVDYLSDLDQSDIVTRVKQALIDRLSTGDYAEQRIADQLNLSTRTLQRRLAEKDVTFKTILESTRRELALQYVLHSDYSFVEITYLLGFSEQSNFSRAFKAWTGRSPSQYRSEDGE